MSTTTNNFNLVKPDLTDAADITAMNQNWNTIDTQLAIANRVFTAHSTDGVAYTVTVEGITALTNGLTITVVPNMTSTSTTITLDLNGLGAKNVRMTLPFSSGNSGCLPTITGWFSQSAPMTLRYHGGMNCWKSDLQRPSAQNLYGTVPITGGGTGGETLEEAKTNLGIPTYVNLGTAPIQHDVREFDYFIAMRDNSYNERSKTVVFHNVAYDHDALEVYAYSTYINEDTKVVTDKLYFYWGDGGYMCDTIQFSKNINTGDATSSAVTYGTIIGVKLPTGVL